jgi:hypothetical protein
MSLRFFRNFGAVLWRRATFLFNSTPPTTISGFLYASY